MITVISPAKKLSKEVCAIEGTATRCVFLDDAKDLALSLKKLDPSEISSLMGISENLSILNWERYKGWSLPFNANNSRQAMYSFQGDTYKGLDPESFSNDDIEFSQSSVRILSGLYGLLRPMDLIMPYRLEMGTNLSNRRGTNLYSFWKNSITKSLNKIFHDSKNKILINCASVEYFKSIATEDLDADVITPVFKELRNGLPKIISFFAKNARGAMTRFIVKNKIDNPTGILDFNYDGYCYSKKYSTDNEPVFIR